MESSFVALRCKVCGGKLDVPEPHVVEGPDGVYSIIGTSTFTCQFCDTEYLPRQSLERFVGGGQVVISGVEDSVVISNIVTGYVGGDIVAGDKIDGDKIVVSDNKTGRNKIVVISEHTPKEKSKLKLISSRIWGVIKRQT